MTGRHRRPVRRFWRISAVRPTVGNLVWVWLWVGFNAYAVIFGAYSDDLQLWVGRGLLWLWTAVAAVLTLRWDYLRREHAGTHPGKASTKP